MRRIAVVGAGIAGLGAAHALRLHADVTLFEAAAAFGGHAHTVDITLDGVTYGVDTGFLVFNERTYPQLIALFEELGVDTTAADMSFSVQSIADGLEWSGTNLATVFAQRRNLLRPSFLRMLADILRFNRLTTSLARSGEASALDQSIAEFLNAHHFSASFREGYFLPMIACIWSCPTEQVLRFPTATLIRFCHNHGLLQVADRPRWYSVAGGSRRYVNKMIALQRDARAATPVRQVRRGHDGVWIATDHGGERFDAVVMACHSDQALALLDDPSADEHSVLSAIRYHRNRAVLHTDDRLLPHRRPAWAAWNYERAANASQQHSAVCLHYLINRLQRLPFTQPVIVSLNPAREPNHAQVHAEIEYAHPVFDRTAIHAQPRIASLQGVRNTWFCGAWTRYGFHEDGLNSGLVVAEDLLHQLGDAVMQAAA